MPTLVPDKLTPLTLEQACEAFADGYSLALLEDPLPACLAVLVAHSALETGNWKSMHCNNAGNVKASSTWSGDYCMFRCNEVIGGKVVWFDPPHPQTWFRAFPTAATGMAEQVRFLSMRSRYAQAWLRAKAGDPEGFVRELAKAGYFTAAVEPYVRAVVSLTVKILPVATRVVAQEHHGVDDALREHVEGLAMLTLDQQRRGELDDGAEADRLEKVT